MHRDGEGEYLINHQPSRLRDIKDLFLGSGAGTDAYCIIEQGRVDVLLQASTRERRTIFEEAAGISRFKAKKVETLRKLERVDQNLQRLRGMTDLDGRPLEVHTLPMPAPLWFAGQRLPASYANFYICNSSVIVPTFNDPNDRVALGILAELFRDRPVTGIHAVDLVWGFGSLHCLTQQQPAQQPLQAQGAWPQPSKQPAAAPWPGPR